MPNAVTTQLPPRTERQRIAVQAFRSLDSVNRIYSGLPVEQTTADAILSAAKALGVKPPKRVVIRRRGKASTKKG